MDAVFFAMIRPNPNLPTHFSYLNVQLTGGG
jgi:hypothetical protein